MPGPEAQDLAVRVTCQQGQQGGGQPCSFLSPSAAPLGAACRAGAAHVAPVPPWNTVTPPAAPSPSCWKATDAVAWGRAPVLSCEHAVVQGGSSLDRRAGVGQEDSAGQGCLGTVASLHILSSKGRQHWGLYMAAGRDSGCPPSPAIGQLRNGGAAEWPQSGTPSQEADLCTDVLASSVHADGHGSPRERKRAPPQRVSPPLLGDRSECCGPQAGAAPLHPGPVCEGRGDPSSLPRWGAPSASITEGGAVHMPSDHS